MALVGHKVFTNIFAFVSREENQAEEHLERHAKASVKSPEPFFGDIGDWTAWKIGTCSSLGLMSLTQALDDRNYDARHVVKNTMVYHMLFQAVVKGTASSTLTRASCLDDANVAWKLLVESHEGSIQREPEAKRTRAFLANLRLDLRTTGHECQNLFQECIQRLEDLGSTA